MSSQRLLQPDEHHYVHPATSEYPQLGCCRVLGHPPRACVELVGLAANQLTSEQTGLAANCATPQSYTYFRYLQANIWNLYLLSFTSFNFLFIWFQNRNSTAHLFCDSSDSKSAPQIFAHINLLIFCNSFQFVAGNRRKHLRQLDGSHPSPPPDLPGVERVGRAFYMLRIFNMLRLFCAKNSALI